MRPPKFKIIEVYMNSHDGCDVQRMIRMLLAITTPGRRWSVNKKMDELVIYEGGPPTLEWTKNDERRLWDAVARYMAIDVY